MTDEIEFQRIPFSHEDKAQIALLRQIRDSILPVEEERPFDIVEDDTEDDESIEPDCGS